MRTLKKALCFALAVVMVLGIGAFSVFAESTTEPLSTADVSADYKVAAKVVSALGVFNGGEGTTWSSPLTRAQAATLLTRLRGVNATTLTNTSNSFTDLDPWAEPYVAYAERAGLILGVGGGRFDPQGALTGYQWALMLLRVLGYVDGAEGVTGDNWQVYTARMARTTSLDNGISDMSLQLTREQAAQMVFNALKADMVEYGTGVSVTTTDGTGIKVSGARNEVTSPESWARSINGDNNIVQLGEQLYKGKLQLDDDNNDDFGRPNSETWKYNGKDIVTLQSSKENLVATYTGKVTYKDLYNDLGSGVVKATTVYDIWVDGNEFATWDGSQIKKSNGDGLDIGGEAITGKSVTTELYREYDTTLDVYTVTVVVTHHYVAQATSDYNSSKGTLSISIESGPDADIVNKFVGGTTSFASTTLDSDDIDGLDQFMAKDWIVFTASAKSGKFEVKSVSVPTKLEGVNVTAYALDKNGNGDTVTAEGTKYSYSMDSLLRDNASASFVALSKSYETNGDSTYDFYLDEFNNVIFAEGHSGSGRYVFVKETNVAKGLSDTAEARVISVEGKESDVVVNKYYKTGVTGTDTVNAAGTATTFEKNKWYRYTLDGAKYRLYDVTKYNETFVDLGAGLTINKGLGRIGNVYVNSATVFIVDDDDSYRVYEGVSKIPTITGASAYAVQKDNDYASYVYIIANKNNINDTTNLNWALVTKKGYTLGYDSANKADTYTYSAVVNGEYTDLVLNDVLTGDGNGNVIGLYYWTTTKYDRPENLTFLKNNANPRFAYIENTNIPSMWKLDTDGDTLSYNGEAYVVSSDAKVWTIEGGGSDATSYSLRGAVANEYEKYFKGTIYVVNKSDSDETKSEVYFVGDPANVKENEFTYALAGTVITISNTNADTDKGDVRDYIMYRLSLLYADGTVVNETANANGTYTYKVNNTTYTWDGQLN